ncbi:hypothetical protein ACWCPF_43720 [Streptomyces sp. NPDC001858]
MTVQNLGLAPAHRVRATFWFAEANSGIVPANAKRIGESPRYVSIPAGGVETLTCEMPWTPQYVAGNHECLVVEVRGEGDPVKFTFRPDLDRHVGQRNMTILDPEGPTWHSTLVITNPFDTEVLTSLHLQSFAVPYPARLLGYGGLYIRPADVLFHAHDPSLLGLLNTLGMSPREVKTGAGLWWGDPDLQADKASGYDEDTQRRLRQRGNADHDFGVEIVRFAMAPESMARIEVNAEIGGLAGQALIHRITQVIEGIDVGGYSLLSLPPE